MVRKLSEIMDAICIYCGMGKNYPWEKCDRCKKIPIGNDLVKSVYYSTGRFANDQQAAEMYREQIKLSAKDIENGIELSYDADEITRLEEERKCIENTEVNVALVLFKIAIPGIIMALIAILIIYVRYCH